MTTTAEVLDAGVPRDALRPIAQALVTAACKHDDADFEKLPKIVQTQYLQNAERLLELVMPALMPRVQFNVQLVARIKAIPTEAILTITNPPVNATTESRRAMLVRALRIEADDEPRRSA
jgi:hypothetical protein